MTSRVKKITFKLFLSLWIGIIFFHTACERHSSIQSEGAKFLQGVWLQDSVPLQEQLLHYTLHEIKFLCDSMYTTMHINQKKQRVPDSCFNNGEWKEFAKAVYVVREDSLIVEGVFTKKDWKQKISGCHRQGQYLPRYKIVHVSKDSLILSNKYEQTPITLRKIKDVNCIPKERWEL